MEQLQDIWEWKSTLMNILSGITAKASIKIYYRWKKAEQIYSR